MIYYEVFDSTGRKVGSNMSLCKEVEGLKDVEYENKREGDIRNVYKKTTEGAVRLVIVGDDALHQSSKMTNRVVDIYFALIPEFKESERRQRQHFDLHIKRFVHNLIKVEQSLKGHLTRLASDSAREKPYDTFKTDVEKKIAENVTLAAIDVCGISHRIFDMDAQIEGLRVISGFADKIKPSYLNINIVNGLFRLLQPFVDTFAKKEVKVTINISHDVANKKRIRVDPQLFNVAMWQLFDNASKYVQVKSEIMITADLDHDVKSLRFDMISSKIEEGERDKIFSEGYVGIHSKELAGDGIGMFMVRKALGLMGATIQVQAEPAFTLSSGGRSYGKNSFLITFS